MAVAANMANLSQIDIHRCITGPFGGDQGTSTRSVNTHLDDIDRPTRKIIRSVREGVGQDHYGYRVNKAGDGADLLDVRIEVAAVLMVDGVIVSIEARVTGWVQHQLGTHGVAIKNTTGSTLETFRRVLEQASMPEPVNVELRINEMVSTRDSKGELLPTFTGHLFADTEGTYPAALNDWETTVVETETARGSFVAWYRNPSRPTSSAVRIAYTDDAGQ